MNTKHLDLALLILRISVGVVFIFMGYQKLFVSGGIDGFTAMLMNLGFPLPGFFAYLVGAVEFFGGIAVLVGFGTRIASALIAVVMLVAFVTAKKFSLPAGNVDIAFFAINIALLLTGPGSYTLIKKKINKEEGEVAGNQL